MNESPTEAERLDRLAEREAALALFSRTLAHDLAAPIRRIRSLCELVELDSVSASERRRSMDLIASAAKQADQLLRDLRSLFYQRSDAPSGSASGCDLAECMRKALDVMADSLQTSDAHVTVDDLPRAHADPEQITSLFQRLLDNAVKYRSERPLRITITGVADVEFAEVRITDNGLGIPKSDQSRALDPLVRYHRYADIPGSGLGLTICARIAEQAGGRLWLESTPERGTTAHVALPIATEQK